MTERKYTKEEILNSDKFTYKEKEILNIVLRDQMYTIDSIQKSIKNFLKKEVTQWVLDLVLTLMLKVTVLEF